MSGTVDKLGSLTLGSAGIPVFRCHSLVVGSGAASLCCAERLHALGGEDILILTDNFLGGTSRNTGSDKQTYYKLADAGITPDSPYAMARALMSGGCMHGDMALVEAQNSLNAFYHLISLGLKFPHNPYGGYTGYKTDHDPLTRGVSLGPYTSRAMTEALAAEVRRRNIPILDHRQVLKVLTDRDDRAVGVLALNTRDLEKESYGLEFYLAENTVLGVGGPGGLYDTSVYPPMHRGGIGMALEAGAEAVNLTESQFGIASVKFRWNLSGSYQQVLPCYYSTDPDGDGRQYFLNDFFDSYAGLCHAIFLKGYQWPFDPEKLSDGGSSLIDLLVFREREIKGRRVFMDFRINPDGGTTRPDPDQLDPELSGYLSHSGAWGDRPIDRLLLLNEPAVSLYRDHGIDLRREPLEIAVCAQHNNGGLSTDMWWESSNIRRLFAVGELNGSHGVYRPGGSALNSGQVGALRAALRISRSYGGNSLDHKALYPILEQEAKAWLAGIRTLDPSAQGHAGKGADKKRDGRKSVFAYRDEYRKRMTRSAGFIRSREGASGALEEAMTQYESWDRQRLDCREQIPAALRNRQMALAQIYYLKAVDAFLASGGGSRGSFLVLERSGRALHPLLGREWNFRSDNPELRASVQILGGRSPGEIELRYEACRPLPEEEFWFETMWKDFREGRGF